MNISKRFFIFCATSAIFCALCAVPRIVYPADAAGVPTSEKARLPALKDGFLEVYGHEPSDSEKETWLENNDWTNTNQVIANLVKHELRDEKAELTRVVVENVTVLKNPAGIREWDLFPDASMSVIPLDGKYYAWWSEYKTFRTSGASPLLSDQKKLSPTSEVIGGHSSKNVPHKNGAWITDVYRSGGTAGKGAKPYLVGFSHIERRVDGFVEKSMAVSKSSNNGASFSTPERILTANKPLGALKNEHQGLGDGCVVKDFVNDRYIAFFSEVISEKVSPMVSMAESKNPDGAPGTWSKWHDGTFSEPGIAGIATPIHNLSRVPGANPSVHFNTYLNKYVMVYASWERGLFISVSDDLEKWSSPVRILSNEELPKRKGKGLLRYPTIVGASTNFAGKCAKLYFAHFPDAPDDYRERVFYQADIILQTQ
jgi:hypothetical protein